jgi:uncharacterized protein
MEHPKAESKPCYHNGFPGMYWRMSATTVNSLEFCRTAGQTMGTTPVAEFARLSADLHDASGELSWAFQGGRHSEGLPQLSLKVKGEVRLVCQRCLTPFTELINAESRLVLVADEAQAEATEERLDDESIDVIVATTAMDLLALVEDEALLSLPLSPRHEVCPEGSEATVNSKLESPFAILKKLK